jgi:hypothetical protein
LSSGSGEAPDNDDARESLDCAIQPERDQGDRSGQNSRDDADPSFDPEPSQGQQREHPGGACETKPRLTAGRDIDICGHNSRYCDFATTSSSP